MPNLASRNDLQLIQEHLNQKSDNVETNELKITINAFKENLKNYCLTNDFLKKIKDIHEDIKSIKEMKANKERLIEIQTYIDKGLNEGKNELQNYKEYVREKFDDSKKLTLKLEKSIEEKADKMIIYDIKDELREKINKKDIMDLEDKVFPLMDDFISKTKHFDEKIDESKRQMLRFDEVIMDKASK